MTSCPFCGLPASVPDSFWPGWDSCPLPCARLQKGQARGLWALFQISSRDGRPGGDKLVHYPSRTGRGPGRVWLVPDAGMPSIMPGDTHPGSVEVSQGRHSRSVELLVSESSVAEAREVMDL